MTIGARIGAKVGSRDGLAVGVGVDEFSAGSDPFATVTRDATSNVYVPASSAEWTTFLSAAGLSGLGNPNSLWLCQEAAGNLADSIGSLTLTAAGATPLYQQAATGWTRKAVGCAVASTARFVAGVGVGPDPATTSQLWVWFAAVTAIPPGSRMFGGISNGATPYKITVNATPRPAILVAAANVVGTASPVSATPAVKAWNYDRAGSRANYYSEIERVAGTYAATVVDGNKGLFSIDATATVAAQAVYGFMYSGANAEMSDANLKLLLQAMGATIPW